MNEVRVPQLVGVPGGKESLLDSRWRFFFTSLIRMTHIVTFYETIRSTEFSFSRSADIV